MKNRWTPPVAPLGVALLLAGCFSYVPAELGTVPPGDEVRLELTRVGFAELPEIPNMAGPSLNGLLMGTEGDRISLRVPVAVHMDGFVTQVVEQNVAVPANQIVRVERRLFNRKKTMVTVGGGLAGLAGIFLGFKAGGNDAPDIPQKDPEEEAGVGRSLIGFSIPIW